MFKSKLVSLFIITYLFLTASNTFAVENLNRGLVAYRNIENSVKYVCVSWRLFPTDNKDQQYNIYMQKVYSDGSTLPYVKINSEPIAKKTFYKYEEKNIVWLRYALVAVNNGVEGDTLGKYTMKRYANESVTNYIEIPMKQIAGDDAWVYSPNDASFADLDGDGELEMVIHREGVGKDNSQSGYTDEPILQAYKIDGTFMWEINLGKNIRDGSHYTQFMVYDLDGDGKAEVVCKTAEGGHDAAGTPIGAAYYPDYVAKYHFTAPFNVYNENADYRNSSGYILSGPEFLTVFEGATGKELTTTEYDPPRYSTYNSGNEIPKLTPTGTELNSRWGDSYGNRVDRFLACVANLGGENASVVMCRGYYTRTVLVAYDFKDGKLSRRWKFDTWSSSSLSGYTGQGNHQLRVGDVDDDGLDEIVYGSMTIDNDGHGLYTTHLNHGDALHLSDYIPELPGLEVLAVHEDGVNGTTLRVAKTGAIIYQIPSGDDVGRGMGTDIDPNHRGMEWWSARTSTVRSAETGESISSSTSGVSMNMAAWWDGDLIRELEDGTGITKYNYQANGGSTTLLDVSDACSSNNSTKSTPCIQADILGDWREEVVWRTSDNKNVRIYMTPYPTDYRFYTLFDDHLYRMSVVYQNVAYNQPTATGFYLGADLENIFPEKHITTSETLYTLDPVFDAETYQWSNGADTKTITLNSADYTPNAENEIDFSMNYHGQEFRDTVYVTFVGTGVKNVFENDEIQLLNNPVDKLLNVRFNIQGNFKMQIYNVAGQLCLELPIYALGNKQVQYFDASHLIKGVYVMNLTNGTQRYSVRFIKK